MARNTRPTISRRNSCFASVHCAEAGQREKNVFAVSEDNVQSSAGPSGRTEAVCAQHADDPVVATVTYIYMSEGARGMGGGVVNTHLCTKWYFIS